MVTSLTSLKIEVSGLKIGSETETAFETTGSYSNPPERGGLRLPASRLGLSALIPTFQTRVSLTKSQNELGACSGTKGG
jgi:hypothetical protein